MTDRELMQEALESIEWLRLHLERDHKCLHMKSAVSGIPDWLNKTEALLRARLAQPTKIMGPNLEEVLNAAGFYKQREWVGLTDEEIEDEWERVTGHSIFGGEREEGRAMYLSPSEVTEFARAIEAAHGIKE